MGVYRSAVYALELVVCGSQGYGDCSLCRLGLAGSEPRMTTPAFGAHTAHATKGGPLAALA